MDRRAGRRTVSVAAAMAGIAAGCLSTVGSPIGADSAPAQWQRLSPMLQEAASAPGVGAVHRAFASDGIVVVTEGPGAVLRTAEDEVVVEAFVDQPGTAEAVAERLAGAGGDVLHVDHDLGIVAVALEPAELLDAAAAHGVRYLAEVRRPITGATRSAAGASVAFGDPCGSATSEGDTHLSTVDLRRDRHVEGRSVEVGMLSDSWDRVSVDATNAAQDVSSGDLPGPGNPCGRTRPVEVMAEAPASEDDFVIDEGRALAQIVHDLAPAADLTFASALPNMGAFADRIVELRDAGADVLVDDIAYLNEPVFQNGPVGVAVEQVVADGATYVTAVGNDSASSTSDLADSLEVASLRPMPCPAGIPGGGDCLDFGNGDSTFGFSALTGTVVVSLQWAEPWFGVTTDLDLHVFGQNHTLLFSSRLDNVTGTQQPFEVVALDASASGTPLELVVQRRSGTGTPRLRIAHHGTAPLGFLEDNVRGTGDLHGPNVYGHAVTPNGISVGAVPYWDSLREPAPYTSRGPTSWLFGPVSGTTPAGPIPELVTYEPDVMATDWNETTFFGLYDNGRHLFAGTSASAAHVAGVAALLIDCAGGQLAPATVRDALRSTARPVQPGLHWPSQPAGLVDALAAADALGSDCPGDAGPAAGTPELEPAAPAAYERVVATLRMEGARTPIASATVRVDDGPAIAVSPVDGAFDSLDERGRADLGRLAPGAHTVCVEPVDQAGGRGGGPCAAVLVTGDITTDGDGDGVPDAIERFVGDDPRSSGDNAGSVAPQCPSSRVPSDVFDDTAGTHRATVECAAWFGWITGVEATRFAPTATTTRGQLASILARLLDDLDVAPVAGDAPTFTDTAGNVHEPSLVRLAAAGIVEGYPDGTARPNAAVTRGQVASMVARLSAAVGLGLPPGLDYFVDDAGSVHESSINSLSAIGVLLGTSDGFRPSERIRREQLASVVVRFAGHLVASHGLRPPTGS